MRSIWPAVACPCLLMPWCKRVFDIFLRHGLLREAFGLMACYKAIGLWLAINHTYPCTMPWSVIVLTSLGSHISLYSAMIWDKVVDIVCNMACDELPVIHVSPYYAMICDKVVDNVCNMACYETSSMPWSAIKSLFAPCFAMRPHLPTLCHDLW